MREAWQLTGPGEVWGAPTPFTGRKAPEGLDGDHTCGTAQDFSEGGEYRPDLPPAPYDTLGYLECCEVPVPPPPITCGFCFTAYPAVKAHEYSATLPANCNHWYKFAGLANGSYTVTFSTPEVGLATFGQAFGSGTSCAGLGSADSFNRNLPVVAVTVTTGQMWCVVSKGLSAPTTYTLRVDGPF